MDLIPRTSYAIDFADKIKKDFSIRQHHLKMMGTTAITPPMLPDPMDSADMFRNDEWKVVDNADYAINTREDLIAMASGDPEFKRFIEEVIECMKYNRSMEEKC